MTLRVLHVIDTCGAGGIEATFLNVLRAWQRAPAWAEHWILAFAGGTLAADFRSAVSELTVAPGQSEAASCLAGDHDVIHFLFDRIAHRWLPEVVASSRAAVVYGKGYDLAGTFRLNGGDRWQPDESLMWAADRVTFTTSALAATYTVPAAHATVLGKAADVARFLELEPPAIDTPDRIVCVANLHALKRLGDLIRAVGLLRPAHPGVCLRLVGDDRTGEGDRLRQLAGECGIASACEWVGHRSDVAVDLRESRIFALPSGREGVPTAMLEAMAAARPVVVTRVGHVDTVVRDGIEGYLVPVGDVEALAARLGTLLTDRSLAATIGRAGRIRTGAHDVRAIAVRLREALRTAALNSRTRAPQPPAQEARS